MATTRAQNADLKPTDRANIVTYLLGESRELKLKRGALVAAAKKFSCSPKTAGCLWKAAVMSLTQSGTLPDFAESGRSRCGRKKQQLNIRERIRLIPWRRRGNLRSLAAALAIPKTTVIRALADGEIVRHSNSIKPFLTDDNRNERLAYCLSFVNPNNMQFCDQDTRIHIDEKWFYLTRSEQTYYLAAGEAPPVRSVQPKRYITKVMFIAAVMRPIIENDTVIFDGKIGMWPFVVTEEAQRSSKNRPAGTPQMKPVGVDRATHRKMMVECVIPAIKRKLPLSMRTRPLIIQQDGARAHVLENDPAVVLACAEGGWNIQLQKQPPNSPDLNVLGLGFFCSIQALQHQLAPSSIEQLVAITEQAFDELAPACLDDTFLSLQQVIGCIIKEFGGNSYKWPHMSKAKLRKQGCLSKNLVCCETAYLAGQAYQFLSSLEK